MTSSHTEELVYATTEDGLLLEGVAMKPAGVLPARAAIVWIHGNAASFSAPAYVRIGRALAALGYPVIIGNTRGHDIACMLWRVDKAIPSGGGAGWERLEDAPRDLAVWVDMAASLGPEHVVLVGHSTGAQRVILYQAERQDGRVAGLVLASPALRGFLPPGELEEARRMVREGHGLDVTPAQPWAPWYRQSAETVAGKAAVLSHMLEPDGDQPAIIAGVHSPILAFCGTREPQGEAALETIAQRVGSAASVDKETLAEADHFYTGHETDTAALIARWIASLLTETV
jgi:pimeloyl-ACP methyl ester carboxylesterase